MFEGINFIKSSAVNDGTLKNHAPMFRRKFEIGRGFSEAKLSICGLGYIYCYINGKKATNDLFTAPVSDYNKTLWYNEYDVTSLLDVGENVFAAVVGNGWFNEVIPTAMAFDKAPWRDTPKLIMCLTLDGKRVLTTDENFKVTLDTPYLFNQLRSGEHFDSRKYRDGWNDRGFDDSAWENALIDRNSPKGIFRKCECEPIRECKTYPSRTVRKIGDEAYLFDFGQNMSGYVRIDVCQPEGCELVIKYAELMNDDDTRNINEMDNLQKVCEIETDRFICNGKKFVWSPKFSYHGFNFAVIEGIKDIAKIKVSGVFVHQDIRERADFECSDDTLNRLYQCGKISSYSNMFYQLTDCPTREKLGWLNDARASAKQMLTNFEIERLFSKWTVDIGDAMREDGSLPGIAPTSGWGYEWGNGPVSDGALFEIPYQVYIQTGDATLLIENLHLFEKYLKYLDTKKDENGYANFGLNDWAAPNNQSSVPVGFINACLEYHFLDIMLLALKLSEKDGAVYAEKQKKLRKKIISDHINRGRCVCDEQTAVSMLIYYGLYDDLAPLKKQLCEQIEKKNHHHDCGMVGLRHLYYALSICGLDEYALKIITDPEYPSQGHWIKLGANTLWEMWEEKFSRNHHMYSDFMAWVFEAILGIKCTAESPGFAAVDISPVFVKGLSYAKGYINTVSGKIGVSWKRTENAVLLEIDVPEKIDAKYKGRKLTIGKNTLTV